MEKYKEDFLDMRNEEASAEDISSEKGEIIKSMLGQEDIDLDSLSDDELDQLLVTAMKANEMKESTSEKISKMIECLTLAGGDENSIADALRVNMGFKLEEAKQIVSEKLHG